MKRFGREYLLARAHAEDEAAVRASCQEAAKAHAKLADLYRERLHLARMPQD